MHILTRSYQDCMETQGFSGLDVTYTVVEEQLFYLLEAYGCVRIELCNVKGFLECTLCWFTDNRDLRKFNDSLFIYSLFIYSKLLNHEFCTRALPTTLRIKRHVSSEKTRIKRKFGGVKDYSESDRVNAIGVMVMNALDVPLSREVKESSIVTGSEGVESVACQNSCSLLICVVVTGVCCTHSRECMVTSHHKQNRVFPWVMWQVWKVINILHFEKTQTSSEMTSSKTVEDAGAWFDANFCEQSGMEDVGEGCNNSISWCPPPVSVVKCNVGVSWSGSKLLCGASWIIRNHDCKALLHSRRAFKNVRSKLEAELKSFCWVVESLASLHYTNVIIESNCPHVREALIDPTSFIFMRLSLPFLVRIQGVSCILLVPKH
ncbi:hypothetical protein HID58_045916 [Brassica napus]|uniref:RNase H type-1 domain-containing protein n=1 Tax=Brassica napus TaxID=3708 RepID=A0ABQ8AVW6_BRANA|nr:hypothetical protein HID58_045916 [Brassica napus]